MKLLAQIFLCLLAAIVILVAINNIATNEDDEWSISFVLSGLWNMTIFFLAAVIFISVWSN